LPCRGLRGFLDLARLARLAHAAQNVLGRLRDRQLPATPAVTGTVPGTVDRIKPIAAGGSWRGTQRLWSTPLPPLPKDDNALSVPLRPALLSSSRCGAARRSRCCARISAREARCGESASAGGRWRNCASATYSAIFGRSAGSVPCSAATSRCI
jgi:hypothetical protein